jgi:hypothetical protein
VRELTNIVKNHYEPFLCVCIVICRVARFFFLQNTKTGKNIANVHKI